MWRSLRLRFLLATVLVVLVAVTVTAAVAGRRTSDEFQRYVERGSVLDYRRFGYLLGTAYASSGSWEGVQPAVEQIGEVTGRRVVVADATGKVVGDSERSLVGKPVGTHWPRPVFGIVVGNVPIGSLYLDPVVNRPNESNTAFLTAVNRSLLVGALMAGLAAVAVTLFLSGRILRPVGRLTAAAQRMAHGDLSVRVPVESDDEIGRLGGAFNAMAGSLAQQEQLRRNMVSDVAHELRTPLTNLRGYLQAARDGLLAPDAALVDNLYEETMLLNRLVADLQELALAEAGQLTLVRQAVSLEGVVQQAVEMCQPQADDRGLALRADLPPDLPDVDADAERVGQILRNLLNNAIAHTPSGGEIAISAAVRDGQVAVAVRDTGEGIAPEDLSHVFDRFYRVDRSRARFSGGAGLGLAIVKQLTLAHGGAVTAASTPGQGSTFTFTLPVASAG